MEEPLDAAAWFGPVDPAGGLGPPGGGGVLGSSRATPSPNIAAPSSPPVTANAILPPDPLPDESLVGLDGPLVPVGPAGDTGPTDGGTPPGPATRNPVTSSGLGPVATGLVTGLGVGVCVW